MIEWMIGTAVVAVTLSVISSYFVAMRAVEQVEPTSLEHAGRGLPESYGDGAQIRETSDTDPRE